MVNKDVSTNEVCFWCMLLCPIGCCCLAPCAAVATEAYANKGVKPPPVQEEDEDEISDM